MNANTLERSPLHLLHRTMQYAEYIFLGVARDLTPDELAVLITLAQHEGVSQHVISERMGIDHDTTTDLVVRLRQKGLLQRRRNAQDPGAYVVKLTVEGSRMLRTAESVAKTVDDLVLSALPTSRHERFFRSLQSVITALEKTRRIS
jgi:DNA-binding MarR family transcriptional regulator